ncbi:MAG: hypothetical protein DHS20C21_24480 [Gemmatimonadota bacterium]|nr:MAG: hypothetical protein DHS20C21_24480 [Gemmatimonadota bacterium]
MNPAGIRDAERNAEIRIGISSCLLGEKVRFDGSHKRDRFIVGTLGEFFRFVPVCPEFDIGLGVPRESLRLVRRPAGIRLFAPKSGTDHTAAMVRYSNEKVAELERLNLSGYLLKRASPSCGMERVRVYDEKGVPDRTGQGIFARALVKHCPLLPVEEEGRLHDPGIRENFFDRVFGYHRMQTFFRSNWSRGDLVQFHTGEKYLLLSHSRPGYERLGRLVARQKELDQQELAEGYRERYMEALAVPATRGNHVNTLQHMAGYFKALLDQRARRELHRSIDDYEQGYVPLVVPMTLIRHYVVLCDVTYLQGQRYLEPHPKELMIRNHV